MTLKDSRNVQNMESFKLKKKEKAADDDDGKSFSKKCH